MTAWPDLPLSEWEPTYKTLHRWTQMVGKLAAHMCTPINHWWHSSLRFTPRGLRSLPIHIPGGSFEMTFDFVSHVLWISSARRSHGIALEPQSVASFYKSFMKELGRHGIEPKLWPVPVEIADPIPFPDDETHASYDREAVETMWSILSNVHRMLSVSRSEFVGKSSPVHFFWGAFDVAVTRFSGRPNPNPPPDNVMGPAYSHEVISHGFWFGGDWPPTGGRVEDPLFYAYAVPQPEGLEHAEIEPGTAGYAPDLGEFVLPYAAVRASSNPDEEILRFVRSTYRAAARLADWPASLVSA